MSAPVEPPVPPATSAAKISLRDQVLAARRRRPLVESVVAAEAIAEHVLAWDAVRRAATVAAYVAVGREPGTSLLLERLTFAGKRVLLPVLCGDNDLDWAVFTGELVPAARGLLEPVGSRLGLFAIEQADVVLVPGLAASSEGDRLGRGGGSYDRALARVGAGVPVAVLLHEDESGRDVPSEPHDRRVTHVVTPAGISP
ncbi:MAG: 5-formyltetrahydrofolate cyclo-ligase [uncultured Nocardioides sp.]|uniref:5-formyltetrahydrofolate cyclo-ligase n=1 Tax=uncultured Nocardioides sp. TaxID=198441 RepID=A0A6J4NBP5_9ACTN|nr:MAG: 5-formyltetrahydrofolate cyclo-ligase [uncultured Nocardioides sp.]